MLTTDESRALAVLSTLVALGALLAWVDARHPRILALTLGDSLALGVPAGDPAVEAAGEPAPVPGGADSGPAAGLVAAADSTAPPGGGYAADGRLDLNRASAEELEGLPGVGPKTAERIVEDRRTRGRFRSPRDLGRVKGIGPKTLQRLLPHITVAPGAAPRPADVPAPAARAGGR